MDENSYENALIIGTFGVFTYFNFIETKCHNNTEFSNYIERGS